MKRNENKIHKYGAAAEAVASAAATRETTVKTMMKPEPAAEAAEPLCDITFHFIYLYKQLFAIVCQ